VTRIFFACDAHGSVPVLRKMAKVHKAYKCDVVMMCGDLTGKAIVPIVEEKPGLWWSSPWGTRENYTSEQDVEQAKKMYEKRGFYWFLTTQDELAEFQSDREKVDKLFNKLMMDRMREWITIVDETIPEEIKVIISPGNDDHQPIDDIIKASTRAIYPLETVVDIDEDHQMISCEWVNTTPWDNTPRECPEDELRDKLQREFDRVDKYENLICNFHAPPYGTRIDLAPKLDENLRVKMRFGRPTMINVGSKSVREMIDKYQPLLGLHGHIHESGGIEHIGRSLCVNSGSVYTQGMLNAFVIDLPKESGEKVEVLNVSA
jgi:Icc-related predicted phosphoesterase